MILCKFYRKLYLKIYCNECQAEETDLILIEDSTKNIYLIQAFKENFYSKYKFLKSEISMKAMKKELKDSNYLGEEIFNEKDEQIIFYFKNNKYIYLKSINNFSSVQFDLRRLTNAEIHNNFSNGVKNLCEYNYLLNKFGENLIKMKDKTFSKILYNKFFTPLIIYRIFIVIIWVISSYQKYLNYKRIFNNNDLYEIPKMEDVID